MNSNKLPEFWKTYVGLVLVLCFGAYLYLVEQKREPSTGDKPK